MSICPVGSASLQQGPADEYVVKLLALFGCVARGFIVVLLFVERVDQRQLVLDCPVSEPLASTVLFLVRVFHCI